MTAAITIEDVISVTSARFVIPREAILSRCTRRRFSRPRQAAMALSYELTGASQRQIARAFERDHRLVGNTVRLLPVLCRYEPAFAADVDAIRAALKG